MNWKYVCCKKIDAIILFALFNRIATRCGTFLVSKYLIQRKKTFCVNCQILRIIKKNCLTSLHTRHFHYCSSRDEKERKRAKRKMLAFDNVIRCRICELNLGYEGHQSFLGDGGWRVTGAIASLWIGD